MSDLKIEAGKEYETRDGRRALCVYRWHNGKYTAMYLAGTKLEYDLVISPIGRCDDRQNSGDDLIQEWIDKPMVDWSKMAAWHDCVAKNPDGIWRAYDINPGIEDDVVGWGPGDYIPQEYAPQWAGDWRNSLVKRP